MKKIFTVLMLLVASCAISQQTLWSKTTNVSTKIVENKTEIQKPVLFDLDLSLISKSNIVSFPNIDGKIETFNVIETSNMDIELAKKYPEIKSYVGVNVNDPNSKIYYTVSPLGLSTMTLNSDKSATFIEPYTVDKKTYVVSRKSSSLENFKCDYIKQEESNSQAKAAIIGDVKLKIFRLALSVTAEYTAYFGGSKVLALSAINNTMTRVNGIYERDFGIHMNLIANNDILIFTNSTSDPYSPPNLSSLWNLQLQNYLTSTIGNANYDIGHLFGLGASGGNAGCVGCVCRTPTSAIPLGKGSAYTAKMTNPSGDVFDVDYVAHEMGHQFGAGHTFTYRLENAVAQIEPGSASTIMGYAGIAGSTFNIQANSDAYFHAKSIEQINAYVGMQNITRLETNNFLPIVNAGPDYTIPKGTPFMLTGSATDANNSGLTYCWEQMDVGSAGNTIPQTNTTTSGPMFRSFFPTFIPTRYFPSLEIVKLGLKCSKWECLPEKARTLRFRLTVRDNHAGAGATANDNVVITVSNIASNFEVLSPNTQVSYPVGSSQIVTWNVGGTTANGVNCANVDILLSTDGGNTYPITLLSATPNDGNQAVTIPNNVGVNNRIMVKGSNHVFYDISNNNFSITQVVPAGPVIDTTPPSAPTNLTPSNITNNGVKLTWDAASDNVGVKTYSIYKDGVYINAVNAPVVTYTVGGLTIGTVYQFSVKAKDAAQNLSSVSNVVSVKTTGGLDLTPPSTPTNLIATDVTNSSVKLSWNPSTDNVAMLNYSVYKDGIYVASVTNGTTYTVTGLIVNTIYKFTVKGKDTSQNLSLASNVVTVKTLLSDIIPPSTPKNLIGSNITTSSVKLTWDASTDNVAMLNYSVYKDGVYVVSVTNGTTYTVIGLAAGVTYNFTVKGKDTSQNLSLASNVVTVKTLIPTNLPLKKVVKEKTQIILNNKKRIELNIPDEFQISVYDLSGRKVSESKDLTNLNDGVYICKIKIGDIIHTQKVLKF